jgi:hypothetical protein
MRDLETLLGSWPSLRKAFLAGNELEENVSLVMSKDQASVLG